MRQDGWEERNGREIGGSGGISLTSLVTSRGPILYVIPHDLVVPPVHHFNSWRAFISKLMSR